MAASFKAMSRVLRGSTPNCSPTANDSRDSVIMSDLWFQQPVLLAPALWLLAFSSGVAELRGLVAPLGGPNEAHYPSGSVYLHLT